MGRDLTSGQPPLCADTHVMAIYIHQWVLFLHFSGEETEVRHMRTLISKTLNAGIYTQACKILESQVGAGGGLRTSKSKGGWIRCRNQIICGRGGPLARRV